MNAGHQRARAEAASWVARLHGPDRSAEIESGLRRWLAESPAHVLAFERATEVWQETSDLPGRLPAPHAPRRGWPLALAATVVCLAVAGVWLLPRGAVVSTAVGEQRTVTLEDGSRVQLNTDSRMRVEYDESARRVVLESGEAFFDVARRQDRPFVVAAGSREIAALGTTFVVRRESEAVSVTLIEGKVAVSTPSAAGSRAVELTPGQRLSLNASAPPALKSVSIERATAWQRGQLIFENTPLREAVAEFNRYGAARIRVMTAGVEGIAVGGVFRIGDLQSFAQAVADSHGLRVVRRGNEILLERAAQP